jgi:hypothetical protein
LQKKLQTDFIEHIKPSECYIASLFALGSLVIKHKPICPLLKEGLVLQDRKYKEIQYTTMHRIFPTLEKNKPIKLYESYKLDYNGEKLLSQRPFYGFNVISRIKRIVLLIKIIKYDIEPILSQRTM